MTGTGLAPAADLRYVPPPARPDLDLHPSRMGVAALAGTVLRAGRPRAARRRLRRVLGGSTGRPCVLTASGRTALMLAVAAEGAAEVVVSTFNCPAVVDAILAAGATPVLVDCDQDGPLLDDVELDGRVVVLTNALGLDEWRGLGGTVRARGGRAVLDLAQAVPAPGVLGRYALSDRPIVLSFGAGKPLGGVGGGALLRPAGTPAGTVAPAHGGWAAVRGAVTQRLLQHAPAAVRSAAVRRMRRSPGWSETKADHLAAEPGRVPRCGPDRWAAAAAAVMLASAARTAAAATRCHSAVRAAVAGRLGTCRVLDSDPGLSGGIELLFHRAGDRLPFARRLAALGIPSTWNYYPLHLMPAYAAYASGPLRHAEALWPRVLTVPKQPQRRLHTATLVRALVDADRAAGGRRG